MTENNPQPQAEAGKPTLRKRIFNKRFRLDELTLLVLLGASYIGVAITDMSPANSHRYWMLMVPLFFVASLVTEWPNIRNEKHLWKEVLLIQGLQWLALLMAVELVFLIQQVGRLNFETTALILLLEFALVTFIAGIRMGWLFRLTGIFLAISLLVLAYLERYLWILLLLAALLLIIHHYISQYWSKRTKDD